MAKRTKVTQTPVPMGGSVLVTVEERSPQETDALRMVAEAVLCLARALDRSTQVSISNCQITTPQNGVGISVRG
jgi:hypothetical protein